MKATEKRDVYANALEQYRQETPVEQWPISGEQVSRSGLARVLRDKGYGSFDRKRFGSSKCAPIIEAMDQSVKALIESRKGHGSDRVAGPDVVDSKEVRRLRREVKRLEKELRNATRREEKYRKRCGLLEAEVAAVRRQHDAFEEHCKSNLRTLHV